MPKPWCDPLLFISSNPLVNPVGWTFQIYSESGRFYLPLLLTLGSSSPCSHVRIITRMSNRAPSLCHHHPLPSAVQSILCILQTAILLQRKSDRARPLWNTLQSHTEEKNQSPCRVLQSLTWPELPSRPPSHPVHTPGTAASWQPWATPHTIVFRRLEHFSLCLKDSRGPSPTRNQV